MKIDILKNHSYKKLFSRIKMDEIKYRFTFNNVDDLNERILLVFEDMRFSILSKYFKPEVSKIICKDPDILLTLYTSKNRCKFGEYSSLYEGLPDAVKPLWGHLDYVDEKLYSSTTFKKIVVFGK